MAKYRERNIIKELNRAEKRAETKLQAKIHSHKCHNCVWAKWQNSLRYCLFPNCIKDGDHNG